ncbi:hypothetical protein [Streptomyces sp. NPDC057199]|uniref:hypothetical protein n=1 Tax=Streptomyces sp. NPDC057199 TaxID=3346047 RepID=UPI003644ADE3
MTVCEVSSAAELLELDARAAGVREVMELPASEVEDLAAPVVTGDPVVQLAAAVLGDRYVDRYAAAQVLGVRMPA